MVSTTDAYFIATAFAVVALLFLLVFIYRFEIRRPHMSLATPFNISLVVCNLSLIGFYVSEGMEFSTRTRLSSSGVPDEYVDVTHEIEMCRLMEWIFAATAQTSYVQYAWCRAGSILDDVFPTCHKLIKFLVQFSPAVFYAAAIPLIGMISLPVDPTEVSTLVTLFTSSLYLELLAGAFHFALDLILVAGFLKFVYKTRMDGQSSDTHFLIICKCGIAASLMWLVNLVMIPLAYLWRSDLLWFLNHVLMLIVLGILISMKLWLHENDKQHIAQTRIPYSS